MGTDQFDRPMIQKELALFTGYGVRSIRQWCRMGFPMPGKVATPREFYEFIRRNPPPWSKKGRQQACARTEV